MNRPCNFLMAAALWLLSSVVANGDETSPPPLQKIPASIGKGEDSLAGRISIPDYRKEQSFLSVIRCQTYVQRDGALENTLCVRGPGEDSDLRYKVVDALSGLRFRPATVGGGVVAVYMNFMVVISCNSGECGVMAVPHHGYQLDELGMEYVAPQAIIDDDFWEKLAWERQNNLDVFGEPKYMFFLSALIDVDGQASDVSIDKVDPAWRTEARRAARDYEKMNFIPGQYEGEPKAMRATDFMGFRLRETGGPR